MRSSRLAVWLSAVLILVAGVAVPVGAQTEEPPTSFSLSPEKPVPEAHGVQTPTTGAFTRVIPIEVPAYFGIEPRLALVYSSLGGNGLAGVGWRLAGYSVIQRTRTGRGAPRYDANDVYTLDGQELLPCSVATTSPGCAAGGTHATKQESYQRIKYDSNSDTWTIWATSGIRTVFSPVFATAKGTFRWGQTSTIDTHGNTVAYNWVADDGDEYLDNVTFGPFVVRIFRVERGDVLSFGSASIPLSAGRDTG